MIPEEALLKLLRSHPAIPDVPGQCKSCQHCKTHLSSWCKSEAAREDGRSGMPEIANPRGDCPYWEAHE